MAAVSSHLGPQYTTELSLLTVNMTKQMKMKKEMFFVNKKMSLRLKRISENGGKTLMQVSDQYLTSLTVW